MPHKILWITWESHRRSLEITDALGIECAVLQRTGPYYLRVPILALQTALLIARTRPRTLFVQNPSMVLAAVACFLKPLYRYRLIVDRHSNFEMRVDHVTGLETRLYFALSRYTVRKADLTIVTNDPLCRLVEEMGGRGFALVDRPPTLDLATMADLGPGSHIVFISSFAPDEPLEELCAAAAMLGDGVTIHVTGRPNRKNEELVAMAPRNVRFTGFLEEPAYQSLLASADGIVVLTAMEETLVCGAYEGVAVGVPLVLSDKRVLREHFHQGAVFTGHEPEELAAAINEVLQEGEGLGRAIRELKTEHEQAWDRRFTELRTVVGDL